MSKEPRKNRILFIDLGFRTKLYLIIKVIKFEEEGKIFFRLYLLPITSKETEDEEGKGEKQRTSIRQYKIRLLPKCMKIDPSFIRYHNYVDLMNIEKDELSKFLVCECPRGCFNQNEYDFIVEKHEGYRNNKLNALILKKPFKFDWSERKKG